MPMVIILPREGTSPFQLYLIFLVTVAGIPLMLGASTNSITDAMGTPESNIWGGALFLGGLFILIGTHWPKDPVTGMLIERTGLVGLGGASLIWSILVVWRVHMSGLFSAILTFGLFLACLAQWRWVNRDVNKVMKSIDDK